MDDRKEDGLRSAAYWEQRAEEARTLAGQMTDRDARTTMQKIATMYDAMAKIAANREGKR